MKILEALILIAVLGAGWLANEYYNRNKIQPPVTVVLSPEVRAYIDARFTQDCNIEKGKVSELESKISTLEKAKAERESLGNKRETFERAVIAQEADRETLISNLRKQEFLKFRNEVTTMCAAAPPFKVKEVPKK